MNSLTRISVMFLATLAGCSSTPYSLERPDTDGFALLSMPLPAGAETWNHPGINSVDGNTFPKTVGSTVFVKAGRRVIGYACPGWISTDSGPTLTYGFEAGVDYVLDCKGTPSIRFAAKSP